VVSQGGSEEDLRDWLKGFPGLQVKFPSWRER
jgi:hypothetical protein